MNNAGEAITLNMMELVYAPRYVHKGCCRYVTIPVIVFIVSCKLFISLSSLIFRIEDCEGKIPCEYIDRQTSIQAVKAFFKGILTTDEQVQNNSACVIAYALISVH